MIIEIGLLLLGVLYLGLILGMRWGWIRIPQVPEHTGDWPMVSIIIAARNEAHQIGRTLDALLQQDYPADKMQILVIDDHSTDGTAQVVLHYTDPRIQLHVWDTPEVLNSYKKRAIAHAISQSKGDWIITTDADCRMGKRWLRKLMSYSAQEEVKMISAPVAYHEEKSLFERLQSLEFLYLIGLGAAAIGLGKASTCNGANLAYRKESFLAVGGFQGIDHLASGDDELLLHKIEAKYPGSIRFCKDPDAIVCTDAKPTLRSFLQQRKRWASKSTQYRNKKMVGLGVGVWLYNLLLLLMSVYAVFQPSYLPLVLLLWAGKMIAEFLFLYPITSFVQRKELRPLVFLLSPIHVLYMVYIGVAGQFGTYEWKGRSVR